MASEPPPPELTGSYALGPSGETLGDTFAGKFKLREKLGEGGMGRVYVADQFQPVQRRVALKVLKTGLNSTAALARFEQERQALALMDHPHIAKVYDGGADEHGWPYLVMELVKGISVTKYCDQEKLTPQERIALFVPVCQAIQHAHQKGIIHRDLKPSNVLVALYDGKPVPKVIDFGVAKATGQRLAEHTVYTEAGTIVGTLEYMAPEQAELNNLDIDTRADIYSLGVILYELLTGSPPFTSKQLRSATFAEMLRLIKEVEPPTPSTRLSSSEQLPILAAQRKLEPRRLTKLVHGDLDWIVMKCLEKERARRYETANGLAADLQRYLQDEPISAGPPTAVYRLRKFLRRNRAAVLTAATVALALVIGSVIATWQAYRATRAEGEANAARDRSVAAEALARENFEMARRAVDTYLSQVSEEQLLNQPGLQPLRKRLLQSALRFYQEFLQQRSDDPTLQADVAQAYFRVGTISRELDTTQDALSAYEKSRELYERLARDHPEDALFLNELAKTVRAIGRVQARNQSTDQRAEATRSFQRSIELGERLVREHPNHPKAAEFQRDLAWSYNNLGLLQQGAAQSALRSYQKALVLWRQLVEDHPEVIEFQNGKARTLGNQGWQLLKSGDFAGAAESNQNAADILEQLVRNDSKDTGLRSALVDTLDSLGFIYDVSNQPAKAFATYQRGLAVAEPLARENPAVLEYQNRLAFLHNGLGHLQCKAGQPDAAWRSFQSALELIKTAERAKATLHCTAYVYRGLGKVQRLRGHQDEALASFQRAVQIGETSFSYDKPRWLYELACARALCAAVIGGDKAGSIGPEESEKQRYADQAMEALRQAVAAGCRNVRWMRTDPDLVPLQSRNDFKKLVAELERNAAPASDAP